MRSISQLMRASSSCLRRASISAASKSSQCFSDFHASLSSRTSNSLAAALQSSTVSAYIAVPVSTRSLNFLIPSYILES
jgi:hypothetical protein